MSFKVLLRVIVFLAILFVMVYMGMCNTGKITFAFPLALPRDVRAPACLIFFGVFAVGVLGGAVLTAGGGGGGRSRSGGKER